jgi:hypothetical protein
VPGVETIRIEIPESHFRPAEVTTRPKALRPEGSELPPKNIGKIAKSEKGAAKSDAFSTKNPEIGHDLARVLEAWPTLPDHIRKAILALVETAK